MRAKARKKATFKASTAPTVIEISLVFTMGSDKGVLEVSARSGKREVGDTTIEWQPGSFWQRES
jgi:hypothetical protein